MDLDYRDEVEFQDMETERKLRVEPAFLKEQYAKNIREWSEASTGGASRTKSITNLLSTHTPFDQALTAYLSKRVRMG